MSAYLFFSALQLRLCAHNGSRRMALPLAESARLMPVFTSPRPLRWARNGQPTVFLQREELDAAGRTPLGKAD